MPRLMKSSNKDNYTFARQVVYSLQLGKALGSMRNRDVVLGTLPDLPCASMVMPEMVFYLIHSERPSNRGIGYVDTALLASMRLQPGVTVWTRDKRLKNVADELRLSTMLGH